MSRRVPWLALLALAPLGDAAAQALSYGQCADRARDRYMRGQADPAIGAERALSAYTADLRECARVDADTHARDARRDEQRREQELDQ